MKPGISDGRAPSIVFALMRGRVRLANDANSQRPAIASLANSPREEHRAGRRVSSAPPGLVGHAASPAGSSYAPAATIWEPRPEAARYSLVTSHVAPLSAISPFAAALP